MPRRRDALLGRVPHGGPGGGHDVLAEPMDDFDINVRGTMHVLEALRRRADRVPLVFASTNKVYGDLHDVALTRRRRLPAVDAALRAHGVGEGRALDFYTPYGCSKGAADQYVLDYARSFGLPACVHAHELHLRPTADGHGGSGVARPFPDLGHRGAPDQHLRRRAAGARRAVRGRRGRGLHPALRTGSAPCRARPSTLAAVRPTPLRCSTCSARSRPRPGTAPMCGSTTGDPATSATSWPIPAGSSAALGLQPALGWQDGMARLASWMLAERSALAEAAADA